MWYLVVLFDGGDLLDEKQIAADRKAIIEKYKGRRSNDPELLLHPAIVEYDELARCEAMVNSLLENYGSENRVHYLQADKDILQKMPYILDLK